MAKVLLLDDDLELLAMVEKWLTFEHYLVEEVHDGTDALDRLLHGAYDVAILDVAVPGMSGIEVLKSYRASGGQTPILLLTGQDKVSDKEKGLDSGADDYLCKPFNFRELSARVRALLRRARVASSDVLTVGPLILDPTKHSVSKNGKELSIAPRDFSLLEFLMRNPGNVFSIDALLLRVWRSESEVTDEAIRASIKRLRKAIDDASTDESNSLIENVPRVGYRLKGST